MPKKKNEKSKVKIKNSKVKKCINTQKLEDNYKTIEQDDYIIKAILPDGNCFYRSLSYFYRDTEDDHKEFRNLITSYISNNLDYYLDYNNKHNISNLRYLLKKIIKLKY